MKKKLYANVTLTVEMIQEAINKSIRKDEDIMADYEQWKKIIIKHMRKRRKLLS